MVLQCFVCVRKEAAVEYENQALQYAKQARLDLRNDSTEQVNRLCNTTAAQIIARVEAYPRRLAFSRLHPQTRLPVPRWQLGVCCQQSVPDADTIILTGGK